MPRRTEESPSVSIIIVNFNGTEYVEHCLTSLLTTEYSNYQIVVVDNASSDGSVDSIKKFVASHPHIILVENRKNLGHSQGCNIGARVANGEYLVFLDSDTQIRGDTLPSKDKEIHDPRNWLLELVKVMKSDKSVGAAQAKIVLAADNHLLDYTCLAVDALGSWHATYGSREECFKDNFEILAASSGCFIVSREIFNEVGGFDPDYFIYDDDTDFSLRTRLLGYRILLVPAAVISHRGGVLRGINKKTVYHSAKNRMHTLIKNYELKNLWWRIVILNFFTLIVSLGFVIIRKFEAAKATILGLLDPIKNLKRIWLKRLSVQSGRRISDAELRKKGFIRNDARYSLQDLKLKLAQKPNKMSW